MGPVRASIDDALIQELADDISGGWQPKHPSTAPAPTRNDQESSRDFFWGSPPVRQAPNST